MLDCDLSSLFNDEALTSLFKRFLVMYDNEDKLNLFNKMSLDSDRFSSYKELFLLPGVKEIRAELYYLSGYKNLALIANSTVDEILNRMDKTIKENMLNASLPLNKEVLTHIAVSKAFIY